MTTKAEEERQAAEPPPRPGWRNLAGPARAFRAAGVVVLFMMGLALGPEHAWLRELLYALGVVGLLTGLLRFCPLYFLLGRGAFWRRP